MGLAGGRGAGRPRRPARRRRAGRRGAGSASGVRVRAAAADRAARAGPHPDQRPAHPRRPGPAGAGAGAAGTGATARGWALADAAARGHGALARHRARTLRPPSPASTSTSSRVGGSPWSARPAREDHPGRRAAALRRSHRGHYTIAAATPARWPATTSAGSSVSAPRTRMSSTRPSGRTCGSPDPTATTTRCAMPCAAPGCSTGWTGCHTAWTPTSASAGPAVRRRTATARAGPRPARRLPGAGARRAHGQPRPADRRRADRRPARPPRGPVRATHHPSAHRLDQVDEIAVMHAGRIVERGTQAELINADGRFAELWSAASGT